jgi:hypothetical protein
VDALLPDQRNDRTGAKSKKRKQLFLFSYANELSASAYPAAALAASLYRGIARSCWAGSKANRQAAFVHVGIDPLLLVARLQHRARFK